MSRGLITLLVFVCAWPLASCSDEPLPGETATFVVAELTFLTEREPDGTVRGFDLDGLDHTEGLHESGCFKPDYVSPEGLPGIDNQLSELGTAVVVFGADNVQTIVQDAVNTGLLLLLVQVGDIHDWRDDDHVTLTFRLGEGPVDVGNDMHLVPGQSFDPRPGYPIQTTIDAYIEDGVLHARDVEVTMPIQILGIDLDFPMLDGLAELRLDEESYTLRGRVGGGVPVSALNELVDDIYIASGMDEGLTRVVRILLNGLADLEPQPDGTCGRMSAGMDIGGVRAFMLDDAP